ncbi:MAG TPA: phosphotransferase [Firmicutes bacterium]|nr:phosphotransferase [Bacillota bacterium]
MKELLTKWGLEFARAETAPIKGGIWQVWLDDKVFVLKHRTNRTRVWAEYDLMNWLKENSQPVSRLLRTVEDTPWAEYDGGFYVLYPYLAGISGDKIRDLNTAYAEEIGRGLADLHRCLARYKEDSKFRQFDVFSDVSNYAWPTVQAYAGFRLHNRLQAIEQDIGRNMVNPYQALPRQLIHRDFHPGNFVFQEGKITGILDFDKVRIAPRIFDLCYLATAVLSTRFNDPAKREEWPRFVQALLLGYGKVQPLSKTEGFIFLYIVYLIQFLFIAFQLDGGKEKAADLNLAMLLWLNEQHEFLEPLIEKAVVG